MKRVIRISADRDINMGVELEIVKGVSRDNDMVELENGVWLKGYRDGRDHTDGNEFEEWAGVHIYEVDDDGEIIEGKLLGYTIIC